MNLLNLSKNKIAKIKKKFFIREFKQAKLNQANFILANSINNRINLKHFVTTNKENKICFFLNLQEDLISIFSKILI